MKYPLYVLTVYFQTSAQQDDSDAYRLRVQLAVTPLFSGM
jgi:hypothetical protein